MKRYIKNTSDLYDKEPIMAMATINPKLCRQKVFVLKWFREEKGINLTFMYTGMMGEYPILA